MEFGKSVISSILSKYISSKKKKTLLIDFDFLNSSINTIFGVKKYNENRYEKYIEKNIIKINDNLNLLCNMDSFIDYKNENALYKIKEKMEDFKKKYEYIIIDTTSRIDFKYIKLVLTFSDKIIFLIEPNLLELKKSKSLLEVLLKDFEIEVDKIKIVFNKLNNYKISESILEEIFEDFEIVGNLEYEEKYNLFINKNTEDYLAEKEYEKIYEKMKV